MNEIKIFLAHTSEVQDDIDQIELAIRNRYKQGVDVERWINSDLGLTPDRFQDMLNEKLGNCEILYIFFHKKIGEYTKEEFYFGFDRFQKAEKPYSMSVFFKKFELDDESTDEEVEIFTNNRNFKKEIREKNGNQYTHSYRDINDLKVQLFKQLEIDINKPIPKKTIQTRSIIDKIFPQEEKIKIYLKDNLVIPRRDPNFVGRESEIHFVMRELINKKQCAITGVIGNGGVGKSAIANEIIHIIQDSWDGESSQYLKEKAFVDGVMWIKLEQEQTLEMVFEEQIIKQLGVKLNLKDFDMELHKLLVNRDILIVLDSAEQNEPIFDELMNIFRNYPILITSRKRQSDIKMIELDTLYAKESFELFRNHLDQEMPKEEEERITKFCVDTLGGLPLAIKIIANYMKESGRRLSEVNQNLLKIEMKDRFRNETVSIDSIFELSYSTLTPQAQKVFAMGSVFVYPFKEEYLFEIAKKNEDTDSISQEIDSLMKISLIEKNKEFYSYHPLLRDYALKKLYSFAFSEAIFEAYKEHLASLSAKKENLPFIYDELLFILDDDYQKGNFDRFFRIVKNLDWWLKGIGYYNRREELLKRGYKKTKELGDKKNEYIFLRSYSDNLDRKGKYKQAKKYFEMTLEFKESKDDFWLHYALYSTEYKLKKYQKSYIKNLKFSKKALLKDKIDYSSFLKTNSWICNNYYQFDLALDYAKINSLVQDSKDNKFKSLNDLIRVYFYQINYEKLLEYIEILESHYQNIDFNIEDKIELKIFKVWVYLYIKEKTLLNFTKDIKSRFNLLEFGNNFYDTLHEIEMLYYIQKADFKNAKLSLEKIRDKEKNEFALGIYSSHQNIEQAQKIFENYLKKEKLSPREMAGAKLYLAKTYAKQNKKQKAVQLLCNAQNIYKSYMNPIEKEIEKEIIESVGIDEYIEIKSTIQIEKIDDEFFLEDLPKSVIAKDGKKMMLIPQGFSIYGVDNFPIPTIDEIFENVEMVLNNDEKLQNIRYLGNFYMDEEAVSNEEYINYCKESDKEIPSGLEDKNPNGTVLGLGLKEMQEYAEFYDKVLPLPEEWEKACRGEENFNYPWGDEWRDDIQIDIGQEDFELLKSLFVDYNSFIEYVEWYNGYEKDEDIDLGILENIQFNPKINVDRYFFFKILFNSLSLDTLEKFRAIDAIPNLSQFQVDELTKVFTEEVEGFIKLEKEHSNDIVKLFTRREIQALKIIEELNLKNKGVYISSISPYGIKDMIGNSYEVTLKDTKENITFKGSILTYDYKERFKAKNGWSAKDRENKFSRTTFRCIKPIFSIEDLDGL